MKNRTLLNTKYVFITTLFVVVLTVLAVWLLGLGQHRTLIANSILSASLLSAAFFLFLTVGLYRGVKLKDNVGKITNQFNLRKIEGLKKLTPENNTLPDIGDGIAGMLFSIVLWIFVSVIIGLILWLFGAILWMSVLIFMAMLYWIFFRALRLVFKKSTECSGQIDRSIIFAFFYTALYCFWIFGMVFIAARF